MIYWIAAYLALLLWKKERSTLEIVPKIQNKPMIMILPLIEEQCLMLGNTKSGQKSAFSQILDIHSPVRHKDGHLIQIRVLSSYLLIINSFMYWNLFDKNMLLIKVGWKNVIQFYVEMPDRNSEYGDLYNLKVHKRM